MRNANSKIFLKFPKLDKKRNEMRARERKKMKHESKAYWIEKRSTDRRLVSVGYWEDSIIKRLTMSKEN